MIERHLQRIRRAGRLPIGGLGTRTLVALTEALLPMMAAWQHARDAHPVAVQRRALRFEHAGSVMEDWLDQRFAADHDAPVVWLALDAGRLIDDPKALTLRGWKLLRPWVQSLLAAASGVADAGLLVGRDATLHITATDPAQARAQLATLIEGWQQGLNAPLPVAVKTALAFASEGKPAQTYEGHERIRGEGEEACLARCYPDFDALAADGRFATLAQTLYAPLQAWMDEQVTVSPHPESNRNAAELA